MTGKKVFFSIKNKIVLALVAILISVTGFNLTYSYMMFKTDKEAYIFENSLRNSELATEKVLEYIKSQSELLAKNKKVKSDSVFLTGELLEKDNKFLFYYNDESYKDNEEKIKSIVTINSKKIKKDIITFPLENNIILILKQSNGFRFSLISKNNIVEMLSKDNIFKYIVTDKTNNIFYGDKSLLTGFKKNTISNSNQGSVLATSNDVNYLISYTQIKKLGIIVYSYISQDSAFAIFKNIIFKNIAFTVVILGIFLILSLLFSKKITTPIVQLIAKTKEIANGNMEGEIVVSTNDELQVLGSSVNIMSDKIMKLLDDKQAMIKELEVANEKLDEYNKNLEGIVAERTKELSSANSFITAMINSLDQGLFVFDKTKQCLDIFTKACESMFKKIPGGVEVPKLLGLNAKEVQGFEKWSNVIFSNMMPFDAAKSLGPKNVVRSKYGKDDFQFISLDYYPMNNEDDQLENVVVVATDKTIEVEAEEKFKEKDAYVSMVLNIIKNKKAFYDFLEEMEEMLINLSNFDKHEDLVNIAMIAFHSMNGGFANYSISHLVKVARDSESQIKSFLGNKKELENLLTYLIKNFRSERDTLIEQIESQLADSKNKFEIDKSELVELKERLINNEDPIELYTEYFERSKVSSLFTPYSDLVMEISKKLNKPMMPILILGGDIRIDTNKVKEFSSTLVHLFRNCMDHGIESTDKRISAGKPEHGSITINCSLDENQLLRLVVQDDGAGINVTKVREILTKKEIDHSKLTDKQAIMYIFQPDFSTAEALTELSGRGVGMSAIDYSIKSLGGTLDLESEVGKGSKFIFELPLA
jgi:methyl-accepting chemotaxis protein